jgi:pyruvate/2-oxoglutarate dehydrogenase complex dihydrolipoamide dehydrogenase (E3) component
MTQIDAARLDSGLDGYAAARRAAPLGAQVVLIEGDEIGGVRPNVSGIPIREQLPSNEVCRVFLVLCKQLPEPHEREGRRRLALLAGMW